MSFKLKLIFCPANDYAGWACDKSIVDFAWSVSKYLHCDRKKLNIMVCWRRKKILAAGVLHVLHGATKSK